VPTSLGALASAEADHSRLLHPDAEVMVSGPDVVVSCDPDRIGGVLRNLLDNAVRAAGQGGRIAVALAADQRCAYVDVLDCGPGVPPADRERIFERLVRLDSDRASTAGGSGLGLAIARGYARAHGGDLVCLQPPTGWGALFRLTLPLVPA
jgi:signal transduction histidine kinase